MDEFLFKQGLYFASSSGLRSSRAWRRRSLLRAGAYLLAYYDDKLIPWHVCLYCIERTEGRGSIP